jgi:hypothetical protein
MVNRLKQDEGHVHEVTIGGETVRTGPPIEAAGGEPETSPPGGGIGGGPPIQSLRLDPQRKGIVSIPTRDPEQEWTRDRARSSFACESRKAELLPEAGQVIWNRMQSSALRFAGQGKGAEDYAEELAWRAIRQYFEIGEFAKAAQAGRKEAPPQAPQAPAALQKHVLAQGATSQGSFFIVRHSSSRPDVLAKYARVLSLPIHGHPGASVRVGIGHKHRNIIDITVPGRLVGTGETASIDAIRWVQKFWRNIWYTAKDELRAGEKRTTQGDWATPTSRLHWLRRSKLFIRPERAKERIAFGEVYVPWEVDLQGQFATAEQVERMAHNWLSKRGRAGEMHGRWVMPDGAEAGLPVQSFIARPGDPDFEQGAWVMGTQYHPEVWKRIEHGEYTGYSIGGDWAVKPVERVSLAAVMEEAA